MVLDDNKPLDKQKESQMDFDSTPNQSVASH